MGLLGKLRTLLKLLILIDCAYVPKVNGEEFQAKPILLENLSAVLGVTVQDGQITNPRPCPAVRPNAGLQVGFVRTQSLLGRRQIKPGLLILTSAVSADAFWSELATTLKNKGSIELLFNVVQAPDCQIKIGTSCGELKLEDLRSCAHESFGKLTERFTLTELQAELASLQARKVPLLMPEANAAAGRPTDESSRNAQLFVQHLNYVNEFSEHYRASLSYFAWCCKDKIRGPSKTDRVVGRLSLILRDPEAPPSITSDDRQLQRLSELEKELRTISMTTRSLVKRADNYYNAEAYKADDFEEGRAIHADLSPTLLQFLDVYKRLLSANLEAITLHEDVLYQIWSRSSELQATRGSLFVAYRKFLFNARINPKGRQLKPLFSEVKQKLVELKRISPPDSDFNYFSSSAYGFVTEVELMVNECEARFLFPSCVAPPREDYRLE